jgi:SAM-dependent methyltransferase
VSTNKLNIGCGSSIKEGFTNLDTVPGPGVDIVMDIQSGCTLPNDFFDYVEMKQVIEHLTNPLKAMENIYNACVDNALLIVTCPHGAHDNAWIDPTHVRAVFPETFQFFGQPSYFQADYGYRGDWQVEKTIIKVDKWLVETYQVSDLLRIIKSERNIAVEIECHLRAVKPIRPRDASLRSAGHLLIEGI